jgi:deoxyribodipyrimidine photolyase
MRSEIHKYEVNGSRTVTLFCSVVQGGERAALERLKYYLWDSDLIANYFNIRNGMKGGDYSTKFAPWLAAGCISPRTIYHEVSARVAFSH